MDANLKTEICLYRTYTKTKRFIIYSPNYAEAYEELAVPTSAS